MKLAYPLKYSPTSLIIGFLILLCLSCDWKKPKKTYLANYIDSLKFEHSLNENPLLVIDGVAAYYESMDDGWFVLKKEEIFSIKYIKKGESTLYGSKDINGVLSIKTKAEELKNEQLEDFPIE